MVATSPATDKKEEDEEKNEDTSILDAAADTAETIKDAAEATETAADIIT